VNKGAFFSGAGKGGQGGDERREVHGPGLEESDREVRRLGVILLIVVGWEKKQ